MGLTWSRRTVTRTAVAGGAVAALAGVLVLAPGGPGERTAQAAALTPFSDCDQLRSWFAEGALPTVGPYGLGWSGGGMAVDSIGGGELSVATDSAAGAPEAARESGGLDAGPVGPGATGTNVQEEGVDEPDLAKTDGSLLVTVREGRLLVVDVSGSTPRELGTLALPGGQASELLLVEDTALVLGQSWSSVPLPEPGGFSPGSDGEQARPDLAPDLMPPGEPTAVLTTVDLSDPSSPAVVSTEEVEGGYVSAREHDGVARVVVQSRPWLPFLMPGGPGQEEQTMQDNRRLVIDAQAQDWLPQRVVRDGDGLVSTEPLLDCADVSRPAEPAGVGVLTVLTLDLREPGSPADAVAVASDGDLVYSSTDRMYVATTRGGWAFPMPIEGGAASSFAAPEPEEVTTQVHAFDVTGRETATYVGSGEVDGWLMGRWAMSEHEGLLRLATTRGPRWGGENGTPDTDAAVSVLEESGDELSVIGSVGGLGRGEQVRAVRWFGDLATVVTFRQTDPLYTVDLADPRAPVVLGELKIPGYSAYLHPLGDGLLLGVGQDATDEGQVLGTQVSTFDLSDLAAPVRVDAVLERESWSDVEWDSRLFSYLPALRTAYVPISGPYGTTLWALQVSADGELSEAARWSPDGDGWTLRAVPVDGGRLAVLHEGSRGAELTLLVAETLRELGSTRL